MVLMLNPRVGLIMLVSSPLTFSTIVVFPELSRPLIIRKNTRCSQGITFVEKHNIFDKKFFIKSIMKSYTMSIRISFSFFLIFLMMLRSPIEINTEDHFNEKKLRIRDFMPDHLKNRDSH